MEEEGSLEIVMETQTPELNMSNLLVDWNNNQKLKKEILIEEEQIKNKVKIFLKERQWNRYIDKATKISVSLTQGKRESFDKMQLKLMLNDVQYAQVVRVTTFEQLHILTPEAKERVKRFVKKPQKMVN